MKPGEILFGPGRIVLNPGRRTVELDVENTSDHAIFVSSHYPFFEVNRRLLFDRAKAWGMHLDLPDGDSEVWRQGETKRVRLVAFGGRRVIVGFNRLTEGVASPERLAEGLERVRLRLRPSGGGPSWRVRSIAPTTRRATGRRPATGSGSATRTSSR